jgi:ribonuclease HI
VTDEVKFLELTLDRKLSFILHIQNLKQRCLKAINLLRLVTHTDWGADSVTLLRIYRSHVRSKLDYGCVVYGSARPSYLASLNRVQNAALRVCLEAFRTSPISSLHVEAGEMPLSLRREKLCLQYVLKLRVNPNNPAYNCVFNPDFKTHFQSRPQVITTLGIRMQSQMSDIGVNFDCIFASHLSDAPPWLLQTAQYECSLHEVGRKSDTPTDVFRSRFNELLSAFNGFSRIYTDGSKEETAVAAAAVTDSAVLVKRLPDHASIFSAEVRAILLALGVMERSVTDQFLILSDSLSCLLAIKNRKLANPLILEIVSRVHELISSGKKLVFMWLPSHFGLGNNTAADAAAKAALGLAAGTAPVPSTDFHASVNRYVRSKWQQAWDAETNNKLHAIELAIHGPMSYKLPRRDEIIIHRLQLGHTHATLSYLMKRENPPQCSSCGGPLTVEHLLVACNALTPICQQFFDERTLSAVFNNISSRKIVYFIKAIGFYRKL